MKKKHDVVLGVGAHPDDLEFGASGTIAKLVKKGWDAYYIIATDGSRGSNDPSMTHEALAAIRKKEQLAAAKILGLKDVFFLNHTDTELVADQQLKEEIVRIIRTLRPRVVITMDPAFLYTPSFALLGASFVNHTDHRAVATATMDAVFPLARDRLTFPLHVQEGLQPHRTEELWFISFEQKQEHTIDITGSFDTKLKALAAHKSQFEDFARVKERVTKRAIALAEGESYNFAESFIRLIMP